MDVASIILNCNNVSFDSFVCQTAIQTEEDKKKLQKQEYPFVFTMSEFASFLNGVDPANVYYVPSLSVSAIYFNKETLAACPCHIEHMWMEHQNGKSVSAGFKRVIASNEAGAANMDFRASLRAIPDGARSEYFNMLLAKYPDGGMVIPNLFRLFFDAYTESDFGCHKIKESVLQKIIEARQPEDEAERSEALRDYPDIITVYRGGSNDVSTPPDQAYSWTTDINVANFFAARLGYGRGHIVKGTVAKNRIVFCGFGRGEKEVFVAPRDVTINETIELKGMEDCEKVIPQITSKYIEYMDILNYLDFTQESEVHGRAHEARVLLLALTIGHYLELPEDDLDVLGTAAVYHDTCRDNDGEDCRHGYEARLYYQDDAEYVDPLVEFLIEYHCRPDEDGYKHIEESPWLNAEHDRAKLLFDVFKDADALDRVRFGARDLDINRLRLPVSKTLSTVANIYLRQIKVE